MFACCCSAEEGDVVVVPDNVLTEEESAAVKWAKSEPQRPSGIVTAVLSRPTLESPWGIKADFADEHYVHICEVRSASGPAAVHDYNASAPESMQLLAGDYIVSVNGVSASTMGNDPGTPSFVAEAFREEMTKLEVTLEVVRPYTFDVQLDRQGEPMGLDLNFTHKGASLVIMKVCPGSVQRRAPEIRAGDRIVAVGGQAGSPEQLLDLLRLASDPLTLTMSRADMR